MESYRLDADALAQEPKRWSLPVHAFGHDGSNASHSPMGSRHSISGISSMGEFASLSKQAAIEARMRLVLHDPRVVIKNPLKRSVSFDSSPSLEGTNATVSDISCEDEFTPLVSRTRPVIQRSISCTTRLVRQGFQSKRCSTSTPFAVRHIKRGGDDWRQVIKPFVADLAFRSLESRRCLSEVSFRPYKCHAAVLFVDLCSYSKITAAIAELGAHALSTVVNAYLSKILDIVHHFGGDVVKFAGDAVLIVWEGEERDLRINMLCASNCALELQRSAGWYPVEGTSLTFRIHCGVCCGPLLSEIFEAPTSANMQRLYHSVGGECIYELSELVDLAKPGEICISESCVDLLGSRGSFRQIEQETKLLGAMVLTHVLLDGELREEMEEHIEEELFDRMCRRNRAVEEDFIHPTVLRLLSHGGLSPTQISQVRNICVLFIAMTSQGSSVNWLMEVQAVLDVNRCPIVQIIDDDKGVHIVAAVNLYETVPEASVFGLEVCRKLLDKQVGCSIGVAMGLTFCGVMGSNTVACRWDIAGPPAVRAARLMQYALANELEVVVDESVYDCPSATSRLELIDCNVSLKGAEHPVAVYSIVESSVQCAYRLLETSFGNVHNGVVRQIQAHIENQRRSCVVVCGIPFCGKKVVCQRAAGYANFVPFLHVSDPTNGLLQLARTIALWFEYSDIDEIRYLAKSVIHDMDNNRWTCAHDQCIHLVDCALQQGLRACFVVDCVQFLDEFSLSLMRECLHGRRRVARNNSSRLSDSATHADFDISLHDDSGKVSFLCVHGNLYNWKTAKDVVEDITRSRNLFEVPIFEVLEADSDGLRTMFRDMADMEVEDRWLDAYAASAGFCAGYFIERAGVSREISGKRWSEGKRGLVDTSEELALIIAPGQARKNRLLRLQQVCANATMRFQQIYDELPPVFQMFAKILAVATGKGFFKLPRFVLWEVLNDLIAQGVEEIFFSVLVDEMVEMYLVKVERENDLDLITFRNPALSDVAIEVCVPEQIAAIKAAIYGRLEPIQSMHFRIPLMMADLLFDLGAREETKLMLWQASYDALKAKSKDWTERELEKWMELLYDEIQAAGHTPSTVLGTDFFISRKLIPSVPENLPLVKLYAAPVGFGPMAHTICVITRNIFHEWGAFYGAGNKKTEKLRSDIRSATARYMKEAAVIEGFLNKYDLPASPHELIKEKEIISFLGRPARSKSDVEAKAAKILDIFIPQVVEPRLKRLYALMVKLRFGPTPSFFATVEKPLRVAYAYLRSSRDMRRQDAAQHSLMILATTNWKPKPVPEYIPCVHYQTVANIRMKTMLRLTVAEAVIYRHQQTIVDFEVFLVITALLFEAQAEGRC